MVKLIVLASAIFTLAVMPLGAVPNSNNAGPAAQPANVASAQSVLENWIGKFRGKTEQQILQELGNGGKRMTWQFGNKHELKLRYSFGSKARLDLLFHKNWVVYTNFSVESGM